MSKNKHIVKFKRIAGEIPHAQTPAEKSILIGSWANEVRKAIRYQKGVAS